MTRMDEIRYRVKNWDQVSDDKEHSSEFLRHSASDVWWLIGKVEMYSAALSVFCKSTENYFTGDAVPFEFKRAIKHYRDILALLEEKNEINQ